MYSNIKWKFLTTAKKKPKEKRKKPKLLLYQPNNFFINLYLLHYFLVPFDYKG